ncbi:hypothetical protein CR513_34178, partial [Mucuna pruriens]
MSGNPVILTLDFFAPSHELLSSTPSLQLLEWLDKSVLDYQSLTSSSDVELLASREAWVHPDFATSYLMTSCSPDERVCQPARGGGAGFVYMYETVFRDLGVILPFNDFIAGVVWILGVAPSQLHSNSWAAMQAFRVICHALSIHPSALVFLNFYSVHLGKKVGWVSLTPFPGRSLFTPFSTSYKGFKKHFVCTTSLTGAPFTFDSQSIPLCWQHPLPFKGIKTNTSLRAYKKEKAIASTISDHDSAVSSAPTTNTEEVVAIPTSPVTWHRGHSQNEVRLSFGPTLKTWHGGHSQNEVRLDFGPTSKTWHGGHSWNEVKSELGPTSGTWHGGHSWNEVKSALGPTSKTWQGGHSWNEVKSEFGPTSGTWHGIHS